MKNYDKKVRLSLHIFWMRIYASWGKTESRVYQQLENWTFRNETMKEKLRIAMFGQKRLSRECGIEIVVKELAVRMVQRGYEVTCYNRSGHYVSSNEFNDTQEKTDSGIRQKFVPTIEKKVWQQSARPSVQHYAALWKSMTLFIFMQRGRHFSAGFLSCSIKK